MTVDKKAALAAAELARLELSPEEGGELGEKLVEDFTKIVGYMDILNEIDTSLVEPLYSPMTDPEEPRKDVPRDEEAGAEKARSILEKGTRVSGHFFTVPRVV
ncbi:MAG: Asp-tRNA(Asn)/Glu-tRNA(Gln) amidotransferase subunit GatC [Deltaproteobacteria bacterium]|jgi:aspartyl-tRNA(Asn)/glutamyl-tRNA(Gln) amidotransferase subunit C|nr:Asp-tRNA(Asn)/Glu-tRNA(Gln) amidotransferase subunit GatC [Deltaproteobacteria bacterium]